MPDPSEPSVRPIALEERAADAARLFSPSAARNRDPILAALQSVLPETGKALEIGSGTGEHIVHFARHFTKWTWHPSEFDEVSRRSISAWINAEGLANVVPPVAIDASASNWGVEAFAPFDAILSANMIHIAPWDAAVGLFRGTGRLLKAGGILFLYGPFKIDGLHSAPSNEAFDVSLKSRNADWGVRDLADLRLLATHNGLTLSQSIEMPANNLSLVFRKD